MTDRTSAEPTTDRDRRPDHRLGHHDEATRWRKEALRATDLLPATQPSNDRAWKRRLTLHILRKEAEQLTAQAAR